MRWLNRMRSAIRNLLTASKTSRDLDNEIRAHVELLAEEKMASGIDPEKARREARMEAGGIEQVKEEVRSGRAGAWLEVLLQDIRSEREVIDNLRKQVNLEMKLLSDKSAELDNKFARLDRERELTNKKIDEAQKRVIDITQNEEKNFLKLAEMYNAMPPENAAKIMQQLADTGKLETAVKVLSQMKETKAAKVLAEMTDQGLAAQLVEKMRGVKRAAPPAMPPGG